MKSALLAVVVLIVPVVAQAYPLYSNQWTHRSVLYFAPTQDHYVRQFLVETLMHQCELTERDVVTIVITEDGFSQPEWLKHEFDLNDILLAYRVSPGQHTAVLVGKDGSEKMRWGKTTDWDALKQNIDAMPMRRQEMARSSSRCQI